MRGEISSASSIWQSLIPGKPSNWRDLSLIQLWLQSYLSHDLAAASGYADQMPAHVSAETLKHLDSKVLIQLSEALVSAGMGLALPRQDPTLLTQVTKVFRLIKMPQLLTANRVGMAHHFARLDHEASSLYNTGLADPADCTRHQDGLTAATNCLDQWCRLIPSEKEPRLASRLDLWKSTMPSALTVQAIWHMEQARRAAREKNLRAAITSIRQAREVTPEKLDNRLHTSLWLLEGMLYRLQGTEDRAQSAWRKARQIAATVTQRHPLHLFDSVLLHSLTQSWDLRTAGEVLPTLAARHLRGDEHSTAQAAFHQTFLTDPAWLTTFNAVLQDERGRKFAEDYALCLDPPRELVLRLYRLLFEHYFLVAAPARAWDVAAGASPWPLLPAQAGGSPPATSEQSTRVHQIVDTLVTEMAMNPRGEMAHLHAYLRAWNDPAAAKSLFQSRYPYSPVLIENMRWLLQQRHP